MALILVIIFIVGVLLGVAIGLPALQRPGSVLSRALPSRAPGKELVRVAAPSRRAENGSRGERPTPTNPETELQRPKILLLHAPTEYDDETCRVFVSPLGDDVLDRAVTLFGQLDVQGEIDSINLADSLDASPSALGGLLTGRLSRRAQQLGLKPPYTVERTDGHTIWRDRQGTAEVMLRALKGELTERKRAAIGSGSAARS